MFNIVISQGCHLCHPFTVIGEFDNSLLSGNGWQG